VKPQHAHVTIHIRRRTSTFHSTYPAGYKYHLYAYDPRLIDREERKAIRTNSLKKYATRTERTAKVEIARAEDHSERPTLIPFSEEDVLDPGDTNHCDHSERPSKRPATFHSSAKVRFDQHLEKPP
jgi:hypothetical protein